MILKDQSILVTGGAGFIGSHFVSLAAKNNSVTVYDNFASSVLSPGDVSAQNNVTLINGDILDTTTLEKAMKGIDIVFHFAVACVRLSLSQEQFVHDTNATGTLNTLLAAKKAGVKRFVYISSSEVYGTAIGEKISETHPIKPTTVYGMSKYVGELYTKHFNDFQDLPGIIVRPFNSYGPRCHFDGVYGEAIPRFVVRALNGKQPTIFGTGKQTRDFTYVTDTVNGIIKAASEDALLGFEINIARGQEVTISDIAAHICQVTGLPFEPIMNPARPNDVFRHYADITKAQNLLKFSPEIPIDTGIKMYIQWVQDTYPDSAALLKNIPETNW